MTVATKSFDEYYEQFVTDAPKKDKEWREVMQKKAREVLDSIFNEFNDIRFLYIQGWTMGFNDGEPIYHQQEALIDIYSSGYMYKNLSYKGATLCNDIITVDIEDRKNPTISFKGNEAEPVIRSREEAGTKHRVLELLSGCEELFKAAWETNWQLLMVRDGDEVTFKKDFYDCGY